MCAGNEKGRGPTGLLGRSFDVPLLKCIGFCNWVFSTLGRKFSEHNSGYHEIRFPILLIDNGDDKSPQKFAWCESTLTAVGTLFRTSV